MACVGPDQYLASSAILWYKKLSQTLWIPGRERHTLTALNEDRKGVTGVATLAPSIPTAPLTTDIERNQRESSQQTCRRWNRVAPFRQNSSGPIQLVGHGPILRLHRVSKLQVAHGVLVSTEDSGVAWKLRRNALESFGHCQSTRDTL